MKYVVISDIHGNLQALEAVIASFPKDDDVEIICAGDVVGYGADPGECVRMIRERCYGNVLGNHDSAVIDRTDITYFNEWAKAAVLWTKEHLGRAGKEYLSGLQLVREETLFTVVHGTLHHPEEFIYMMSGADALHTFEVLEKKICFVGHSHVPGVFALKKGKLFQVPGREVDLEKGAKYIINAGSVGQPRDGDSRACYCVYDTEKERIEFRRIVYDIEEARTRIINAGLPRSLGDRLLSGF